MNLLSLNYFILILFLLFIIFTQFNWLLLLYHLRVLSCSDDVIILFSLAFIWIGVGLIGRLMNWDFLWLFVDTWAFWRCALTHCLLSMKYTLKWKLLTFESINKKKQLQSAINYPSEKINIFLSGTLLQTK